jgi:hypothetical protein
VVFVGSNLGLSYTPDAAAAASAPPPRVPQQRKFHNASINKAAYDYFFWQMVGFPTGRFW